MKNKGAKAVKLAMIYLNAMQKQSKKFGPKNGVKSRKSGSEAYKKIAAQTKI